MVFMASIGKRVDELGVEVHARVDSLGEYLRSQRENAQMSLRQLAAQAGVSNPYLSQVERGLRKPSAEVLQQIATGLRISAEALYIRAGILDSERLPDVEAAIAADPGLNDRQRRALLDIYASFRAENRRHEESAAEQQAPSGPAPAEDPAPAGNDAEAAAPGRAVAKRATVRRATAKRATATRGAAKRIAAEGDPGAGSAKPAGAKPVGAEGAGTETSTTGGAPTRRPAARRSTAKSPEPERRPRARRAPRSPKENTE